MKLPLLTVCLLCLCATPGLAKDPATPDWHVNVSVIEACSCPMFCQCYFNSHPASHHGASGEMEHFCKFNNAYKVNDGHYGDVDLTGAMLWVAGDLGAAEFSSGQGEWATMAFDSDTTPAQREAMGAVFSKLFPIEWKKVYMSEGQITMDWDDDHATALLDEGSRAEVQLIRNPTATGGKPTILHNLQYWGVPENDGFVLMPNTVEAFRCTEGSEQFEYNGTNGFMLHFDVTSEQVAANEAKMAMDKAGHHDHSM